MITRVVADGERPSGLVWIHSHSSVGSANNEKKRPEGAQAEVAENSKGTLPYEDIGKPPPRSLKCGDHVPVLA